jgi:L-methionine (R)-S-oxide reductase
VDNLARLGRKYQRITNQLKSLFSQTDDPTARMATICALLHHKMDHYFWTGFYLLKDKRLIVGPYQGPLACQVLSGQKGVCWTGILKKQTFIVPDVHEFPGHVACDSRSRSEIVVPWISKNGKVRGVLDVDSRKLNAFSGTDADWLKKIVSLLDFPTPPPSLPS